MKTHNWRKNDAILNNSVEINRNWAKQDMLATSKLSLSTFAFVLSSKKWWGKFFSMSTWSLNFFFTEVTLCISLRLRAASTGITPAPRPPPCPPGACCCPGPRSCSLRRPYRGRYWTCSSHINISNWVRSVPDSCPSPACSAWSSGLSQSWQGWPCAACWRPSRGCRPPGPCRGGCTTSKPRPARPTTIPSTCRTAAFNCSSKMCLLLTTLTYYFCQFAHTDNISSLPCIKFTETEELWHEISY